MRLLIKVIKIESKFSSQNFFQITNHRICFSILTSYQDRKTNSLVPFLGRSFGWKICFQNHYFFRDSILPNLNIGQWFHWFVYKNYQIVLSKINSISCMISFSISFKKSIRGGNYNSCLEGQFVSRLWSLKWLNQNSLLM